MIFIGLVVAIVAIVLISDEPLSGTEIFNTILIACLSMLASEGLSSYFPREDLVKRSLVMLIGQHVLMGLVFAGTVTLFLSTSKTSPARDIWDVLRSFIIMAVFFGGWVLILAILARRKLFNER